METHGLNLGEHVFFFRLYLLNIVKSSIAISLVDLE